MDCRLPGFSVHGILQARILEWVAISSSRAFSWPRDRTQVSCIAGRFFTIWAAGEALIAGYMEIDIFSWTTAYLLPCLGYLLFLRFEA